MTTEQQNPTEGCSGDCGSCAPVQPQAAPKGLPPKVMMDVHHVILVLSGKGGVGKSTVATNLASAFAAHGRRTGLLDLDIHGPSIPKMLGVEDRRPVVQGRTMDPIRITGNLSVMSMGFLLPDASSPVIWRGPVKMAAIRQFLEEVNWGPLDYLIVDLPPGTGDEALTIAQLAPNVRGAVIVTTPQDVAVIDAMKAARFIEKLELPVIGVIENMSGMVCPHCGGHVTVFSEGGGKTAADELGVPFLGAIPLDPEMVKAGDEGRPYILQAQESPTGKIISAVMEMLIARIGASPRK